MTSCCPHPSVSESTGKFFSKRSKSYARSFRKGKLEKIQQYLIDEICKESLEGKTILDIGSGVGKLHLSLLKRGASFATGIDMSEAMIDHAKAFAQKFGIENKTAYHLGDFMVKADSVTDADITLLDKVVCCYEDLEGLVSTSADKTKFLYALTFPTDNFLMKFWFKTEIVIAKLFRADFRPYWHQWKRVEQLLNEKGFFLIGSTSTIIWHAALYKKNN